MEFEGEIAHINTTMKARDHLRLWVDLGVVADKDLSDRDLVLLGSKVHRSEEVLGSTVDVGTTLQQQLRYVGVAFLGCQMQRRVAILPHRPATATTVTACSNHDHNHRSIYK